MPLARPSADQPSNMINAVLVFNNNGQPRLTKFYSQIVGLGAKSRSLAKTLCPDTGAGRFTSAAAAHPDLQPRLDAPPVGM